MRGPATLVVTPMALLAKKSTMYRSMPALVRPIALMSANVSTASGECLSQSIRRLVSASRASGAAEALGKRKKTSAKRLPSSGGSGSSSGPHVDRHHRDEVDRVAALVELVAVQGGGHRTHEHVVEVAPARRPSCFGPTSGSGSLHTTRLAPPGAPSSGFGGLWVKQQLGDDAGRADREAGGVADAPRRAEPEQLSDALPGEPEPGGHGGCWELQGTVVRPRARPCSGPRRPPRSSPCSTCSIVSTAATTSGLSIAPASIGSRRAPVVRAGPAESTGSPSVRDSSTLVSAMPSASEWWMRRKIAAPCP